MDFSFLFLSMFLASLNVSSLVDRTPFLHAKAATAFSAS